MRSSTPRAAPNTFSPSAPTLASFSSCTGTPRRACISAAGRMPCQPGRMPSASISPVARLIGAARPMPTPSRRSASMPALAQARAHELVGEVEALGRGVVDLGGRPVVGDELAGEIADRRRGCAGGRSRGRPRTRRRGRARAAPAGARWAAGRRLVGGLVLLDDAGLAELLDERRDRRPREAGPAREIGAARCRLAVERLDDPQPVHLAQAERGRIGGHAFARNITASTALDG